MITFEEIIKNEQIRVYIKKADEALGELGFTEHSFAHVTKASEKAAEILATLGYDGDTIRLARIAGYLHDIGNVVNRVDHAQSGAVMAFRILDNLGADAQEIAVIVGAIGNHDESTGVPVTPVAAALILADKTDVRRSRVRNTDPSTFDIHDRVNYAVSDAYTSISTEDMVFALHLTIDKTMSSVMDYFEIFLGRMLLCRKAAEKLGLRFSLIINGQVLL